MDTRTLNLKTKEDGYVRDVIYISLLIDMKYGKNPWAWTNRDNIVRRGFYLEKENMEFIEEYQRKHGVGQSHALNMLLDQIRVSVGKKF